MTKEGEKKKEIAAANQLLAVIRGEKVSIEVESGESADASDRPGRPEPVSLTEKTAKSHRPFSLFAKRTIGLDVGSHSVKCVHLEKRGFNRIEVVHAEAVEISPGERELGGVDAGGAKVDAIKRLVKSAGSHRAKIVSAVGGVSTAIRQIELPKMSGKELSSSVRLWARNYIPFDVNEVQLDYQVFGFDKSTRRIRLLLVAVIKDYIQQHIKLLHQAHIDPMLVDINPLAVMNALLFNEEFGQDQSIIVLDVGDRNTTLCIYSETDPYFVRNLMVSGSDFTRDVQRKLGLPYGDAERYKRGELVLPEERAGPLTLIEIIRPSLEALIKEVRRSLTYYENQTKTRGFSEIVLTGGSAEMKGLADFLGGELGLPVRILDPFRHVETRNLFLPGSSSQYSLALGLALREST